MSHRRDRSPPYSRRSPMKISYQEHARNHRDWAGLPRELLRPVLEELISIRDYICFRGVCRDWQSLVLEDYKNRSLRKKFWENQQLPLLLLPPPTAKSSVNMRKSGFFYSLTKQNMLTNTRAPLLHHVPKRFVGSSFGWLVLVDDSYKVTLFNPLTTKNNNYINTIRIASSLLDSRSKGIFDLDLVNPDYFVGKAVLSADPALSPNDYVVALTYDKSKMVAFIRPGEHRDWCHAFCLRVVEDIYFSSLDDSFYGLLDDGAIVKFGLHGLKLQHISGYTVAPGIPLGSDSTQVDNCMYTCLQRYMVQTSQKDLLQIRRFGNVKVDEDTQKVVFITTDFKVFKPRTDTSGWEELKSLGDDILFLGDNNSLAVRASDFLECRPGSIYYTFAYNSILMDLENLNSSDDPTDMGVYDLETRSFYPFNIHLTGGWCDAMAKQPPIWIVPTFQSPATWK